MSEQDNEKIWREEFERVCEVDNASVILQREAGYYEYRSDEEKWGVFFKAKKSSHDQNAKLIDALKMYANTESWRENYQSGPENTVYFYNEIIGDLSLFGSCNIGGKRARQTLKELGVEDV